MTKKEGAKIIVQAMKKKAMGDLDWDKYFELMTDRHDNETISFVSMAVQYVNLVQAADRLECQLVQSIDPEKWDEVIMPVIDVDGVEHALEFSSTVIRCFLREREEESALIAADMIVRKANNTKIENNGNG